MASRSRGMKVMNLRMSHLALLQAIYITSAVVLAAAPESSECVGQAPPKHCALTSTSMDEDLISMLQVQAAEVHSPRHEKMLPDALGNSGKSHANLGPRHTELKSKISEARASLAAMEAELAGIETAGSATVHEADEGSHNMPKVDTSDGAVANFIAKRCPQVRQPTARSTSKSKVSLLQAMDGSDEDSGTSFGYPLADTSQPTHELDQADLSWRGMSHFQVPTVESHVSGRKCQQLPSVHNVGGPAALPNILANTIVLYQQAGYEGSKLRDMVSNELSKQLSNGGPWNVVAGVFDWNLYNEATKFCTVAVKFQVDEPDWYSDWIAFGA